MRAVPLVLLVSLAIPVAADELCGTSPRNDAIVRAVHALPREHARLAAHASPAPVARGGAIYLQADEQTVPGYHPFDLAGKSIVFEPRPASAFRVHNEPLRYVEPLSAALRDFESDRTPLAHDLPFSVTLFGRGVSRIYATAFNSIQLDAPAGDEEAMQVDAVEAAMHEQAVIAPLLITTRKPRYLAAPRLFIDDTPDAVIVTWRSDGGDPFRYDVQAEIRRDGVIVFSYKDVQAMSWGAPVLTPGAAQAIVTRDVLAGANDNANDLALSFGPEIRNMLDIRRVELSRINGSDLFSVRITLAASVNPSLLGEGQSLLYRAVIGEEEAEIEIDRNGNATLTPFGTFRPAAGGASIRVSGDTIELFGRQSGSGARTLSVETWIPPLQRYVDLASVNATLSDPPRASESDLSALTTPADVPLPVMEAFTLAPLDPYAVYDRVQAQFALNDAGVDAVAIYQTFYTDIVFFAGAYSTGGNARVEGTGLAGASRFRRAPSLLHMNQLTYNYSSAEETASKVMLHELGHRWMYFVAIKEDGKVSHVLNPVSAHPAGYVHTPAAFPVYGDEESSVMGGGYFVDEGGGAYRARAANMGYSWTDLYLMGVATRDEVPDWFYLANTNPPLAQEYWPPDGATVSGEKRPVSIAQIVDVHGVRTPTPATSQRRFNVVFVLVTEPGVDATDAQAAKVNEWRALLERNFSIATGGRASVATTFVVPAKKRATR